MTKARSRSKHVATGVLQRAKQDPSGNACGGRVKDSGSEQVDRVGAGKGTSWEILSDS